MAMEDQTQELLKREALETDKADLLGLLDLRFGGLVSEEVKANIEEIDNQDALERLIIVAANILTWEQFVEELKVNGSSFKIVGEQYRPF